MRIAYIDGRRLRRGLEAGARRLVESAGLLDRINVFPVADGDTGANMAATIRALSSGLALSGSPSIGGTARLAADAALSGARGNSGAILAQFFQGLAEDLAEEARVGTRRFARAVRSASSSARAALSSPKEGTIITVLHDWAEAVHRVAQRSDDFIEMLKEGLEAARASLERTKELLPELKKAGVVDAGALGFVRLIEGVATFIQQGRIRELSEHAGGDFADAGISLDEDLPLDGSDPLYRYCIEALIAGKDMDMAALRDELTQFGDSIVVAGSARFIKAHLHSDSPSKAFAVMERHGQVEQPKVDDMLLQTRRAAAGRRRCAVIADSAGDIPDELKLSLGIETVPVQVIIENRSYLDGLGLCAEEFTAYLKTNPARYPTTSQPTAAAFQRKYDLALGHADEAVYIGISEALSGTLEAGRRSAYASKDAARLRVFDSRQLSVSAGLVAKKAAEAAAAGEDAEGVLKAAEEAAGRVKLLVAAPTLEGLMRSGRLKGVKGLAARAFGLRPILTVGKDGKAASAGMYLGPRKGIAKLLELVAKDIPEGYAMEAIIAHVDAHEDAASLAKGLAERYSFATPPAITTLGPALAVHGGLGAIALAYFLPKAGS
jgi:uncharacterized protein